MKQYKRVFLIDDDETLNEIHSKILRFAGYQGRLSLFKNGQDALDEVHETIVQSDDFPDLIFLDINMPGIDGWTFLKEFERLILPISVSPHVYILSSYVTPAETEKMRAQNHKSVKKVLSKPFTIRQLKMLIGSE